MKLFDVYPQYNITPVKGEDIYIYDEKGTKYLDFYGGHAVISIGHSNPIYISKLTQQLAKLSYYSNAVQNPLQNELATRIGEVSGCKDYNLFLCNSGTEANENALKIASFHTQKSRVIAFKNSFHGRTSASVAVTDNDAIKAPLNKQHITTFLPFNDVTLLEKELQKNDVCAVIIECIQGIGGLDQPTSNFMQAIRRLCTKHNTLLIADEIQSGFGRSGDFFAFQHHVITPDLISVAKGMGNGFPVGGVLIGNQFKAKYGMLGTTYGGNHLACAASLAVLEVIEKEKLINNVQEMNLYFLQKLQEIPQLKQIKGRGLMLGLEFDFNVSELRKALVYKKQIITGSATNKNLLRILPALTVSKVHIDKFTEAVKQILENEPVNI